MGLSVLLTNQNEGLGRRIHPRLSSRDMDSSDTSSVQTETQHCRLSVVIIAKNEAHNLARCLRAVSFADEIIVVEHGSDDETINVALANGAKVVTTHDWPGFGTQKNRALMLAKGVWVLSVDADEVVCEALQHEICAITAPANLPDPALTARHENNTSVMGYEIARLTQFRGKWIRHCGWTPDRVLRLIKRGEGKFSDDLVHEKLNMFRPNGKIGRLNSPLLHFSYAEPDQYWIKLQRYSVDWARNRFEAGQTTSMSRAVLSASAAFFRTYFFRLGFLDGAMGFAVCWMQAQAAYSKYFELYCLHLNNVDSPTKP